MAKSLAASLFVVFVLSSPLAATQTFSSPIRQTELLALVAGNALPENIVAEIQRRNLAFAPDDAFRSLLKTAGADASILTAVNAAKRQTSNPPYTPNKDLLQHIANAGKLIREKHFDQAAEELNPTVAGNFEKYEIGFVVGELLRQAERWQESAAVYAEVLREAPDFPEAHTKLSYVIYRLGDADEALRQAKIALSRAPQNAEAHKNAGLALELLGRLDAALAAYKEALRIKPDYQVIHYDLGLFFYRKGDFDASIAEYRKSLALKPNDVEAHYNLGVSFQHKGDVASAIREYRETKSLDPNNFQARLNLGGALMSLGMTAEAVKELRQLEAMAPDSEICHLCMAKAFYSGSDYEDAEKEYRKAAELDPSDPEPLLGIGRIHENAQQFDAALVEYRKAEELDETSGEAHRDVGRVLLAQKKVRDALKEFQQAVELAPTDAYNHDLYAQTLEFSGDNNTAISEFQDAVALDPKSFSIMLELAAALEKKGDWAAALNEYHQAAMAEQATAPSYGPSFHNNSAEKYKDAQERFAQQLASLRKAGKSAEAARLEKSIGDQQNASGAAEALDSLMFSGSQAFNERRFDDSERDYKKALDIADKLQPHDQRLVTTLNHLGQLAVFRHDFAAANILFERQLKVSEEMFGAESGNLVEALQFLGMNAMAAQDYPAAEKFLNRDLELNKKVYGESSQNYMNVLRILTVLYANEKAYEKAEAYALDAADLEAKLYQYNPNYHGLEYFSLLSLCNLYDRWGNAAKIESCDRRLIPIIEKLPGPDTHLLEMLLTQQAKALRNLGRSEEAAKIEERLKSLQPQASVNPN
jgi:tetratricopeptide (TPR) repeat protein